MMKKFKYIYKFEFPWVQSMVACVFFTRFIRLVININNPFIEDLSLFYFAMVFTFFGSLALSYSLIISVYLGHKNIVLPYRRGDYLTVQGNPKIEHKAFMFSGKQDQFEIEEIRFKIPSSLWFPGYKKSIAHGGYNFKETDYVLIKYVPYQDENHIMEINIIQNESEGEI
jgi:hypothetical protein